MESLADLKDKLDQYKAAMTVIEKVEKRLNNKSSEKDIAVFDMIDAMEIKYGQIAEKVIPLWQGEAGEEFVETMNTAIDKISTMNNDINEAYLAFIKEKAQVELKIDELQGGIRNLENNNGVD